MAKTTVAIQKHNMQSKIFHIEYILKILGHHWLLVFQVEDDEKLNVLSQSPDEVSARSYLCTGYDIFLVWEPCAM